MTGGSSITVTQSNVTGAGFSLSSGPAVPFVLAPGQRATLVISFGPTSAGSARGALSIISDAANSTATVSLSGAGLAQPPGQLAVAPATMNFGTAVGSSKSQTGTLTASRHHSEVRGMERSGILAQRHYVSCHRASQSEHFFWCNLRSTDDGGRPQAISALSLTRRTLPIPKCSPAREQKRCSIA